MSAEVLSTDFTANKGQSRSRWWDISAAILLLLAMFTAASRLEATEWSKSLSIVPYVAIFGTIAGLALGQSRFSSKLVALTGFAYGIFIVGWQLGSLVSTSIAWDERISSLTNRASLVLTQIANQQKVADSILFIISMAILFWTLSLVAGYTLTRHGNAWWAILPTGFVIFIIHSFDPLLTKRTLYLALYISFGLVLVARMAFLHHNKGWQSSRTYLPPHLGFDFLRFALVAVALVVLISWTVPALAKSVPAVVEATKPLRNSWQDVRHRWENAFASLRSSVTIYSDYYGENIALGRGSVLANTPMFTVTLPQGAPSDLRYYWQAATYDSYAGGQWTDTAFVVKDFDPKSVLYTTPEYTGRSQGTFEFAPETYVSTLYTPAQPLWVSPIGRVHLAQNTDGTVDIGGFRANSLIRPGQTYQVQASVSNATVSQLRDAGTDYPDWVKARYLEIPPTITPRTIQLAKNVTSGIDNPYDKVVAVTSYLRNNMHYTATIPPVPAGREPIDWFLFDLRQGFCNYYASAEVVLLRSIGIPARWAIGYAQGQRQDNGQFLVRQSDAHSWPEVFFPGLGWVEFEPTVSQPEIVRVAGSTDNTSDALTSQQEQELLRREELEAMRLRRDQLTAPSSTTAQPAIPPVVPWLIGAGLIIGIGYVAWKNRKRISLPPIPIFIQTTLLKMGIQPPRIIRQWAIWAALPSLSKSYLEINRALVRLGNTPQPTHTPAERAEHLGIILPPAKNPAERLLDEYQLATFSKNEADTVTARKAGLEIRKLSFQAIMDNFLNWVKHPFSSKRKQLNPRFNR